MNPSFLDHRSVAVIGAGRSGRAAARLLYELGADIRLLEKKTESIPANFALWLKEKNIPVFGGEHRPEYFQGVDLVIPSPAAAKSSLEPLLAGRKGFPQPEIMAETELAWRLLEGEPIIGITGTSGKTTTTSLCSAMLQSHGLNVFTGGNIGTPLSEYVLKRRHGEEKADVIVLELSSFQLQTCSTLHPQVGILLNVSENHLDFHKDMQEYLDAKMNLFSQQAEEDTAILPPQLSDLPSKYRMKASVRFLTPAPNLFPDTRLIGSHNQSNAEAA
ncbi:MAG: Mur ligase family protein, partial [Mailhella sp.]